MRSLIFSIFLFFVVNAKAIGDWKFIADLQIPSGEKFQETVVGGLSGLFRHGDSLYALSDDRGKINEPRIYQFKFTAKSIQQKAQKSYALAAIPEAVIFLKDKNGSALIKQSIDPEGLVVLSDGSFLVASEGNLNLKPRLGPQLLVFAKDGKLKKEIPLPSYFVPESSGQQKRGIRNNLGPEGLTMTPSGKFIYVAIENVLVQDGVETSFENEGLLRVLRFKVEKNGDLILDSEKAYPMSKVTHPKEKALLLGTGVSEVKAMDDDTLLFMERSASQTETQVINEIKLFKVQYSSGDEIKSYESLAGKSFKPLVKNLSLDLSQHVASFQGPKVLDNMEALEFGPLVEGQSTLVILSDDNFLPVQRNLWLLMALPESL